MNASDEKKILRILREIYTFSMYVGPDGPKLADEFHPEFQILVPELDGRTGEIADAHWLRPTPRPRLRPKPVGQELTFSCQVLDITGKAAATKVEVHRSGHLTYTDYVLLCKVAREWRIVGKIFHQHAGAAKPRT
jgi:hypothetical protein